MKLNALRAPTRMLRTGKVRADAQSIEREGGVYEGGLIRSVAIITVGEALGHGMWIDQEFVDSVSKQLNRAKNGIKSRFTHPGMSSDGMGKHLGRAMDSEVDGPIARADLHFTKTAHVTPDGDLATYVMSLAEETPEDFGMSIVFEEDYGATQRHKARHTDKDGQYTSPDPANSKNLPHVRLSVLHGVDAVDEPAANPGGMFHRGPIVEFERLAEFALGMRADSPECHAFNIHPDRMKRFIRNFLSRHGLEIVRSNKSAPLSARRQSRHVGATVRVFRGGKNA